MKITATLKKTNLNNYQSVTLQRDKYSTIVTDQTEVPKLKRFFNLKEDGDTNTKDLVIVFGYFFSTPQISFIKIELKNNIIVEDGIVCDKRTATKKGWFTKQTYYDDFPKEDATQIILGDNDTRSFINGLMPDLKKTVDNKVQYLFGFPIDN